MRIARLCRPVGAGVVLTILTGCAGAEKAPPTVRIVATEYAFDLPAEIPSGPTRLLLVNQGTAAHHGELVRFAEGKGVADLDSTLNDQGRDWAVPLGGPAGILPGDSTAVVVTLPPGHYGLMCFVPGPDGRPHLAHGMKQEFIVSAQANGATAPKADADIHLVDYGFQAAPGALAAGKHLFRIVNDAAQGHEIVFMRVLPGHTADEFLPWFQTMQGPPPITLDGGISALAPHTEVLSEVQLVPGTYVLICFLSDMKDDQPHFTHGMMQVVEVS